MNELRSIGNAYGTLGGRAHTASMAMIGATQRIGEGLSFAALAAAGFAVKFGSAALESENMAGRVFGNMYKDVEKFSDKLGKASAMNEYEVREQMAIFMNLGTALKVPRDSALEMSKALTQLGSNMSSFYNAPVEETMKALRSGMVGNVRALRKYGISLDEMTVKDYAFTHGIAAQGTELSRTQKTMAAYGEIMLQAANAHGDFIKSFNNSPVNQFRMLMAQLRKELADVGISMRGVIFAGIQIGETLIPVLKKVSDWFGKIGTAAQLTGFEMLAAAGPLSRFAGALAAAQVAQGTFSAGGFLAKAGGIGLAVAGGLYVANKGMTWWANKKENERNDAMNIPRRDRNIKAGQLLEDNSVGASARFQNPDNKYAGDENRPAKKFSTMSADPNNATLANMRRPGDENKKFDTSAEGQSDEYWTAKDEAKIGDQGRDFNVSSSLLPPGRATGGMTQANKTYVVGEKGPEIFVPATDGYIVPNHKTEKYRDGQKVSRTAIDSPMLSSLSDSINGGFKASGDRIPFATEARAAASAIASSRVGRGIGTATRFVAGQLTGGISNMAMNALDRHRGAAHGATLEGLLDGTSRFRNLSATEITELTNLREMQERGEDLSASQNRRFSELDRILGIERIHEQGDTIRQNRIRIDTDTDSSAASLINAQRYAEMDGGSDLDSLLRRRGRNRRNTNDRGSFFTENEQIALRHYDDHVRLDRGIADTRRSTEQNRVSAETAANRLDIPLNAAGARAMQSNRFIPRMVERFLPNDAAGTAQSNFNAIDRRVPTEAIDSHDGVGRRGLLDRIDGLSAPHQGELDRAQSVRDSSMSRRNAVRDDFSAIDQKLYDYRPTTPEGESYLRNSMELERRTIYAANPSDNAHYNGAQERIRNLERDKADVLESRRLQLERSRRNRKQAALDEVRGKMESISNNPNPEAVYEPENYKKYRGFRIPEDQKESFGVRRGVKTRFDERLKIRELNEIHQHLQNTEFPATDGRLDREGLRTSQRVASIDSEIDRIGRTAIPVDGEDMVMRNDPVGVARLLRDRKHTFKHTLGADSAQELANSERALGISQQNMDSHVNSYSRIRETIENGNLSIKERRVLERDVLRNGVNEAQRSARVTQSEISRIKSGQPVSPERLTPLGREYLERFNQLHPNTAPVISDIDYLRGQMRDTMAPANLARNPDMARSRAAELTERIRATAARTQHSLNNTSELNNLDGEFSRRINANVADARDARDNYNSEPRGFLRQTGENFSDWRTKERRGAGEFGTTKLRRNISSARAGVGLGDSEGYYSSRYTDSGFLMKSAAGLTKNRRGLNVSGALGRMGGGIDSFNNGRFVAEIEANSSRASGMGLIAGELANLVLSKSGYKAGKVDREASIADIKNKVNFGVEAATHAALKFRGLSTVDGIEPGSIAKVVGRTRLGEIINSASGQELLSSGGRTGGLKNFISRGGGFASENSWVGRGMRQLDGAGRLMGPLVMAMAASSQISRTSQDQAMAEKMGYKSTGFDTALKWGSGAGAGAGMLGGMMIGGAIGSLGGPLGTIAGGLLGGAIGGGINAIMGDAISSYYRGAGEFAEIQGTADSSKQSELMARNMMSRVDERDALKTTGPSGSWYNPLSWRTGNVINPLHYMNQGAYNFAQGRGVFDGGDPGMDRMGSIRTLQMQKKVDTSNNIRKNIDSMDADSAVKREALGNTGLMIISADKKAWEDQISSVKASVGSSGLSSRSKAGLFGMVSDKQSKSNPITMAADAQAADKENLGKYIKTFGASALKNPEVQRDMVNKLTLSQIGQLQFLSGRQELYGKAIDKIIGGGEGAFIDTSKKNPISLPRRAEGGVTKANNIYQIGENGPEIFVPEQNGYVIPNHKVNNFRGAAQGHHRKHGGARAEGNVPAYIQRINDQDQNTSPITYGNTPSIRGAKPTIKQTISGNDSGVDVKVNVVVSKKDDIVRRSVVS